MKSFLSKNNWWFYFILTYLFSWTIWFSGDLLLPDDWQDIPFVLGAFGPMAAALVLIGALQGKTGLKNWLRTRFNMRINFIWYLAGAILLPFGLAAVHHLTYLALGGQSGVDIGLVWLGYFVFLIPTALLSGGNEEPGWRGYITPVLLKRFKPVVVCIIVGIAWAVWHMPMYVIGDWGGDNQPFSWLLLYCIPLSVIMTWLFYRSKMSIIPVMLMHAGGNIVSRYFPMETNILDSVQDEFTVIKTAVFTLAAIVILVATKGTLGYKKELD